MPISINAANPTRAAGARGCHWHELHPRPGSAQSPRVEIAHGLPSIDLGGGYIDRRLEVALQSPLCQLQRSLSIRLRQR